MTHTIELTMTDGDRITTKINGEEKEVYDFYRQNNFQAWCSENQTQVKRLEFIDSPLLSYKETGSYRKSLVYLFIDYHGTGFYQ